MDILSIEFVVSLVASVLIGYIASKLIVAIIKQSFKLFIKVRRVRYTKNLIESGAFYMKD